MDNLYVKIGVGIAATVATAWLGKKVYSWCTAPKVTVQISPAPAPAPADKVS